MSINPNNAPKRSSSDRSSLPRNEATASPEALLKQLEGISEVNSVALALEPGPKGLKARLQQFARKAIESLRELCGLDERFKEHLAKPDTSAEELRKIQEESAKVLKQLSEQVKALSPEDRSKLRYDSTTGEFVEKLARSVVEASANVDTDLPPEIVQRACAEGVIRVREKAQQYLESHLETKSRVENDATIKALQRAIEKATASPLRVHFHTFDEAIEVAQQQDRERGGKSRANQHFVERCLEKFREELGKEEDPELSINVARLSHLVRECRNELRAEIVKSAGAGPERALSEERAIKVVELLKQGEVREGLNLALSSVADDSVLAFHVGEDPKTGALQVGRPITKSAIQRNKNDVLKGIVSVKGLLKQDTLDESDHKLLQQVLGEEKGSISHHVALLRSKVSHVTKADKELGGVLLYASVRLEKELEALRNEYRGRTSDTPSTTSGIVEVERSLSDTATSSPQPEREISPFEARVSSLVSEILSDQGLPAGTTDFRSEFERLARSAADQSQAADVDELATYTAGLLRAAISEDKHALVDELLSEFRSELGIANREESKAEGATEVEKARTLEAEQTEGVDQSPSAQARQQSSAVERSASRPILRSGYPDEHLQVALEGLPNAKQLEAHLLYRVVAAPKAWKKTLPIHQQQFERCVNTARDEIRKHLPEGSRETGLAALDKFIGDVAPAIEGRKGVEISPYGRVQMEAVLLRRSVRYNVIQELGDSFPGKDGLTNSIIRACRSLEKCESALPEEVRTKLADSRRRLQTIVSSIGGGQKGFGGKLEAKLKRLEEAYETWLESAKQRENQTVQEVHGPNQPENQAGETPSGEPDQAASGDEQINQGESTESGAQDHKEGDKSRQENDVAEPKLEPEPEPEPENALLRQSLFERSVSLRTVNGEVFVSLRSPTQQDSEIEFRIDGTSEEILRRELEQSFGKEGLDFFRAENTPPLLLTDSPIVQSLLARSNGRVSRIANLRIEHLTDTELSLNVSGGLLENVDFIGRRDAFLQLNAEGAVIRNTLIQEFGTLKLNLTNALYLGGRISSNSLTDSSLNNLKAIGVTVATNRFLNDCSALGARFGVLTSDDGTTRLSRILANEGVFNDSQVAIEASVKLDQSNTFTPAYHLDDGTVQREIEELLGEREVHGPNQPENQAGGTPSGEPDAEREEYVQQIFAKHFRFNLEQGYLVVGDGLARVQFKIADNSSILGLIDELQGILMRQDFDLCESASKEPKLQNNSAVFQCLEEAVKRGAIQLSAIENLTIEKRDLSGWALNKGRLKNVVLSQCTGQAMNFDELQAENLTVRGCTFDGLRAQGLKLSKCRIVNNRFKNSQFDGSILGHAFVQGNRFEDCTASHAVVGGLGGKSSQFAKNTYTGQHGYDVADSLRGFQYEESSKINDEPLKEHGEEIPDGTVESHFARPTRPPVTDPTYRNREYGLSEEDLQVDFSRTEPKTDSGPRVSATLQCKPAQFWRKNPETGTFEPVEQMMPFLEIAGEGPMSGAKMSIPLEPTILRRVAGNPLSQVAIQEFLQEQTEGLEQIFQPNGFQRGKDGRPKDAGFQVRARMNTNCPAFHRLMDLSDRSISQLEGVKVVGGNLAAVDFGRVNFLPEKKGKRAEPVVKNCVFKDSDMRKVRFSRPCESDFKQGDPNTDTSSLPKSVLVENVKILGCRADGMDARRVRFTGKVNLDNNSFRDANFNLADIGNGTFRKNYCSGHNFQLDAQCFRNQANNPKQGLMNKVRKGLIARHKFKGTKFPAGCFGENEKYLPEAKDYTDGPHQGYNTGQSIAFFKAAGFDQPNYAKMETLPDGLEPICGPVDRAVEREVAFHRMDDTPPRRIVVSYLGDGDAARYAVMTVQAKTKGGYWQTDDSDIPALLRGQMIRVDQAEMYVMNWLRKGWYPFDHARAKQQMGDFQNREAYPQEHESQEDEARP